MKNILFLTSTNLASNPRLVKEIRLASKQGFHIKVIQFYTGNWSDGMTDAIKQEFTEVEFIELSALRKPFVPWLLSSALQKFYSLLPLRIMSTSMLSVAAGKRALLLLQQVKKIQGTYDWVIAHNPAAFYPAYWYAKKRGAKLGIDVEDYHPGETTDLKVAATMKKLMQCILPKATYCSYAAPLIMKEVNKDVKGLSNQQVVLLNGFDADEFVEPVFSDAKALQLVWFSQNIDAGRGLEHIIPVVNELYPIVELHLIGSMRPGFETSFLQNKTGITIHPPKNQKELHKFLSFCDVGIAADIPVNRNREIALTNKIIAYAQAGLYITAFDTEAQRDFLETNELQYQIAENTQEAIRSAILSIDRDAIRNTKEDRFIRGQAFDWHLLSKPLVDLWHKSKY
jgi:hypothetical protein